MSADYLAVVLPNRLLGAGKGGVAEERKAVVNLGFWFKNELAALNPIEPGCCEWSC